ncbi:LOW QUALITY PROTEIN: coiled-coil domain-containing protein 62 [Chlamydotis macqueenii]
MLKVMSINILVSAIARYRSAPQSAVRSSPLPAALPQELSPSPENSTVQKQRRELQLLMGELEDGDKELNETIAVHQRQLLAWEDDWQKILTLAERCNLLENELNKRNAIIKSLTERLKFVASQQNELENTPQKVKELSEELTDQTAQCQALEVGVDCAHVYWSVLELSAKTGQLQAREREIITMLKLKDKAILETTDHITELTSKFKKLRSALCAAKTEEFSFNKEKQELILRLKELTLETDQLRDDLSEKMKEKNKQQEEVIHLRQENDCLRNELALTVSLRKQRDQLLQCAKPKQAWTDQELSSLRQIYVKQQRDLRFLCVSLENSQELSQKHEKVAQKRSEENLDLNSFHLDSSCLTSTQKGDRPRCEKFSEVRSLSGAKPTNRCCSATTDQDTSSPISKLRHALAESRQMVADLELNALLHASPCCSANSSSVDTTTELAEALHRTQLSAAEERDAKLPLFSL